jgi:hypothetical protein
VGHQYVLFYQEMMIKRTLCWGVITAAMFLGACSEPPTTGEDAGTGVGADADDSGTIDDGGGDPDGAAANTGADATGDSGGGTTNKLEARSLRFKEDMHAVWGTSAEDVWWAGAKGRVLHFNGSILVPRDSGTDKDLHGVWGRSSSDVWFAGKGVILHYNNGKFFNRTPKNLTEPFFRTVHAPADGSTVVIAGNDGLVMRVLDDGTLHKEATNSGVKVYGLFAVNAGVIWGMGSGGQALRLSGGTWSETTMPSGNGIIAGITGAQLEGKTRLMAVGELGYVAATESGTWKSSLSSDPKSRDLRGVWAVSGKEAWAVGVNGALVHMVGASESAKWNVQDIDGTYMKTATFNAVWGISKDSEVTFAHAVGDDGAGLTYSKGKWLDFRAETTAHVLSVTALPDGRMIASGASGLLLSAKDGKSEFVDLGATVTGATIHDAASDGPAGGFWAVGDGGVVVHGAKSGGLDVMVPTGAAGKALRGVADLGAGKALVVGDVGTAMLWSGSSWTLEKTGVQHNLRSVAAAGGKAWAVGELGTVLRREAGKWAKESAGELTNLHRVVAWGDGEAAAVGDNGVVLVRDKAGKWSKVFEKPALFLYGIDRTSDGTLIAVGWKGTCVVGKAGKFTAIESGLPNVLRDVAASKDGVVAVGHKGGIYQLTL